MVATFKHLVAVLPMSYAVFNAAVTTYPSVEWVWTGAVRCHQTTSPIVVLLALITVSVVGLLIWSMYGYHHVECTVIDGTHNLSQWVTGFWSTTGPIAVVLPGLSALVALATILLAKNSGLVSSIALVVGFTFGIDLSRYGLSIAYFSSSNLHRLLGMTAMHFETVGATGTFGTALLLALPWGISIGILGLALGTLT